MKNTHARTGSIAMAGAALLAASLTAGPALAAKPVPGPDLQTVCAASGGTFSTVKGVKKCVTTTVVRTDGIITNRVVENDDKTLALTYDVSSYTTTSSSTTQTQKANQPIQTLPPVVNSSFDVDQLLLVTQKCFQDDANGEQQQVDTFICAEAGLIAV